VAPLTLNFGTALGCVQTISRPIVVTSGKKLPGPVE
jgi:hypothetical protein